MIFTELMTPPGGVDEMRMVLLPGKTVGVEHLPSIAMSARKRGYMVTGVTAKMRDGLPCLEFVCTKV